MRTFLVALVVGLSACAPTAGEACSQGVESYCNSGNTVLWCDGGLWVQYSCPGGCRTQTANTTQGFCTFIGSKAGDRCPSYNSAGNTLGFCADSQTFRTCVVNNGAGVWTDTACTKTCESGCL
jgi:hypothetical protein